MVMGDMADLRQWGREFDYLHGVALDPEGAVHVVENNNCRI